MRILIMLDPTNKRGTKMAYTDLRNFLISDGYLRIGTELFMRITSSRKTAEKHIRRLNEHNPGTGIVRVLKLPVNQSRIMIHLTCAPDLQEEIVGANGHTML